MPKRNRSQNSLSTIDQQYMKEFRTFRREKQNLQIADLNCNKNRITKLNQNVWKQMKSSLLNKVNTEPNISTSSIKSKVIKITTPPNMIKQNCKCVCSKDFNTLGLIPVNLLILFSIGLVLIVTLVAPIIICVQISYKRIKLYYDQVYETTSV